MWKSKRGLFWSSILIIINATIVVIVNKQRSTIKSRKCQHSEVASSWRFKYGQHKDDVIAYVIKRGRISSKRTIVLLKGFRSKTKWFKSARKAWQEPQSELSLIKSYHIVRSQNKFETYFLGRKKKWNVRQKTSQYHSQTSLATDDL